MLLTGLASVAAGAALLQGGGFLWYAIVFFVLALIAGFVGFQGVAGISMEIARIFVLIFLVLAVVSLLL
ncbi:DUF1328 domain-containing protein [Haloferacaceae archaeon DSL9]